MSGKAGRIEVGSTGLRTVGTAGISYLVCWPLGLSGSAGKVSVIFSDFNTKPARHLLGVFPLLHGWDGSRLWRMFIAVPCVVSGE